MRKFLAIFLISFLFFNLAPALEAAGDDFELYFFRGEGCPHCAREEIFLEYLQEKYPQLKIRDYEVWYNQGNAALLQSKVKEYGFQGSGIPVTLVGKKYFIGYQDDESTGVQIEAAVQELAAGLGISLEDKDKIEPSDKTINVPIWGSINIKNLSLPVLTLLLGILDGFNPCAMWVLVFLIALLINLQDRRKMWLIGGTFILVSGVVYYVFLAAWLNVFLFIGYLAAVRFVIGLIAIAAGASQLKDFYKYKEGECKVTENKSRFKIIEKIKELVKSKALPATLAGIILLAFSVNLIELLCSAGLPATYTEILVLSGISTLGHYLYLFFYVVLYMLDDMIVFAIAVTTLQAAGFTGKYSRWSNLFGGIIILLLGILLIFAPEVLMFG